MRCPALHWKTHDSVIGKGWLYLHDECIAVVGQRLDGSWHCTVNRHREPAHWRGAACRRRETARMWAERWAEANAAALIAEAAPLPGLAPMVPHRV